MKQSRKKPLRVRVSYEPNRFSQACLEKIYDQLNPVRSREVTPGGGHKNDEEEPHQSKGEQR